MRILYLCGDRGIRLEKQNGGAAHFRSLVRALSLLGHELLVLTPSDADEEELGVPVSRIPTPRTLEDLHAEVDRPVPRAEREHQRARRRVVAALGHIWDNVLVEQAVHREIERFRPDFVFELYAPYLAAGTLACNRLGVPHVLNVHAPLALEGATYRRQALQDAAEALEDSVLRNARKIVTNSREMRQWLVDDGVDAGKIEVVINGVDLDLFSRDGPTRRAAPPDRIVVGFSGSLKAWHGVDVLCTAFRQAAAADPRLHLLVVGDGPLRGEVRRLETDLPDRVTLTGSIPMEEVPPWVRGMDIAVAPYPPLEPFYFSPLKILDAMACGVANLASRIGQVPELLLDGDAGLLVPPGDPDELAAAIRRLADDEPLRRRLAEAGRCEAHRRHAWTGRASEIVELALQPAATATR